MSGHTASGEKASPLSNILAIIGLIILVIIVIWGVVHLVELGSGWFGSLFEGSGPSIQIEAPTDATAGAPVTVSWNYTSSTPGNYSFIYQCQSGFQFALISTSTNTAEGMPCGAAFAITPSSNSILLLPVLSATSSSVSVPFSLTYTTSAGAQIEGSATMDIHPGSNPTPIQTQTSGSQTTTSKPATTQTSSGYTAPVRAATPADLTVQILAVGVIDPVTGQFVDRAPTSPSDMAAVEFNIANIGGSSTGTWYFQATLPTVSGYLYTSPAQAPLGPGAHIINTLRFTEVRPGGGEFSVIVNPNDGAYESNYGNNSASQYISMSSYYDSNSYSGGNTTYYQSQPYTY